MSRPGRVLDLLLSPLYPGDLARLARAVVEFLLIVRGWRWSRRLSLWIDRTVILEERGR